MEGNWDQRRQRIRSWKDITKEAKDKDGLFQFKLHFLIFLIASTLHYCAFGEILLCHSIFLSSSSPFPLWLEQFTAQCRDANHWSQIQFQIQTWATFANQDSFEVHPTPILPVPSGEKFPFEASVYPSAFWDAGLGFWCGAIYIQNERALGLTL